MGEFKQFMEQKIEENRQNGFNTMIQKIIDKPDAKITLTGERSGKDKESTFYMDKVIFDLQSKQGYKLMIRTTKKKGGKKYILLNGPGNSPAVKPADASPKRPNTWTLRFITKISVV